MVKIRERPYFRCLLDQLLCWLVYTAFPTVLGILERSMFFKRKAAAQKLVAQSMTTPAPNGGLNVSDSIA